MSLLSVQDLTVRFRAHTGPVAALTDVSLDVAEGEAVGVVGESGSGKSTLLRAITGLVPVQHGSVELDQQRIAAPDYSGMRRSDRWAVQMVFQDPYASLDPRQTAHDAVAEAVSVWHDVSRGEVRTTAGRLLSDVGISHEQAIQRPAALSGGQRQRVSVARALAPNPRILLADEPTSSIDQSAQAQLVNLFSELQLSRGLAILFVSHDLSLVQRLTTRVVVLRDGRVVEAGATREVLRHPKHPYTQALVDAMPGRRGVESVAT